MYVKKKKNATKRIQKPLGCRASISKQATKRVVWYFSKIKHLKQSRLRHSVWNCYLLVSLVTRNLNLMIYLKLLVPSPISSELRENMLIYLHSSLGPFLYLWSTISKLQIHIGDTLLFILIFLVTCKAIHIVHWRCSTWNVTDEHGCNLLI